MTNFINLHIHTSSYTRSAHLPKGPLIIPRHFSAVGVAAAGHTTTVTLSGSMNGLAGKVGVNYVPGFSFGGLCWIQPTGSV